MTKKLEKLSCEEWEKMGALIKLAYDLNLNLIEDVGQTFGKSSKIYKKLDRIYSLSMEVKSMLDDEVCVCDTASNNKLFGDDAIKIFYSDWYGDQEETARNYIENVIKNH